MGQRAFSALLAFNQTSINPAHHQAFISRDSSSLAGKWLSNGEGTAISRLAQRWQTGSALALLPLAALHTGRITRWTIRSRRHEVSLCSTDTIESVRRACISRAKFIVHTTRGSPGNTATRCGPASSTGDLIGDKRPLAPVAAGCSSSTQVGEGGRSSAMSGSNSSSPRPEPARDTEARLVRLLLLLLKAGCCRRADSTLPRRADPCLEIEGRCASTCAPSLLSNPRERLPADPSGLRGVEGANRLRGVAEEGT